MPVMHGPGIRDPKKMQEREISDNDVQAYAAIGWKAGPLPKDAKAEDVEIPSSTVVKATTEEAPNESLAPKKKARAKKAKK